jgi:hypothetical protein
LRCRAVTGAGWTGSFAMKRLKRRVLHYSACLIVLATVATWPSAGWPKTARHTCDVDKIVRGLLQNWGKQLKDAWSENKPELIVRTYAENGVLLPTCSKGPLSGHGEISGYFVKDFLPLKPVANFDFVSNPPKIGGDCTHAFASGLYGFKLEAFNPPKDVQARYTYVFTRTLIAQHHSSLVPTKPPQECPPKP